MALLPEWLRYRRERRVNRRALNKERAGRAPREGQEIGYMSVGKGNKSRPGTAGTGGVWSVGDGHRARAAGDR
jgi:hypothetical protein